MGQLASVVRNGDGHNQQGIHGKACWLSQTQTLTGAPSCWSVSASSASWGSGRPLTYSGGRMTPSLSVRFMKTLDLPAAAG